MKSAALLFSFCFAALFLAGCGEKEMEFSMKSVSAAMPEPDTSKGLAAAAPASLHLAAGDKLTIEVWGQDSLTKQVMLDSSGAIYYPLIGKINALGMTVNELQAALTEKLSRYYVNPQVTVMPFDLAGQCYYVLGDVSNPGKFTIKAKTAVIEAAAAAGGPTKHAGKFIVLLRKQKDKLHIFSIPIQFQNVSEKNAASVAMQVQANDILFLPPSKISNVESFMKSVDSILSPLLNVERGVMYWPVFKQALEGTSGEVLVQ